MHHLFLSSETMLKYLKNLGKPTVSVIRFAGAVRDGGDICFRKAVPLINKAFEVPKLQAVAIEINSNGGSAAQSCLIRNEIRRRAAIKKVPVYAFMEDVVASAGYILACSADKIYANECTILGSIGTVSVSFGLDKVIEKMNIGCRIHTAGKNKVKLTSFTPETEDGVKELRILLDSLHKLFINLVKESRGDRLDLTKSSEIFEGDIWMAAKAKQFGLIDDIGDLYGVMASKFPSAQVKRIKSSYFDMYKDETTPAAAVQNLKTLLLVAQALQASGNGPSGYTPDSYADFMSNNGISQLNIK